MSRKKITVSTWKVHMYIAQVHLHTRRVHVCTVPIFLENMMPRPSCSVYMLCLFCSKYDDDMSPIFPTLVRESIWYRFSFAVLSGGRFF